MTTETPPSAPVPRPAPSHDYKEPHSAGWVMFASAMLALIGVSNIIGGIGAVSDSKFYVGGGRYLVGDLKSLGWIVLIVGAVQLVAALGIYARSFAAVWIGFASAGVNAASQLLFLPSQPLFSLAVFAVDIAILYGLIVYAQPD